MHCCKEPGHLVRKVLPKIFLILDTETLYVDEMERAKQIIRMFINKARQLSVIYQKAGKNISEETSCLRSKIPDFLRNSLSGCRNIVIGHLHSLQALPSACLPAHRNSALGRLPSS